MMKAQKIKSEFGFVGYFDILGYQTFLENNDPDAAAQVILDTILRLEKDMPRKIRKELDTDSLIHGLISKIKWLVFSDTVLLTLSLDETKVPLYYRPSHLGVFLMQCAYLWQEMFDFGLPLRGVVTAGPFSIQKTCFVGKSIVDAYKTTTQVGFAGCVITDTAINWADANAKSMGELHDTLYYKYAVPYSGNRYENGYVLNVAAFKGYHEQDVRQAVHESFWKHNKDLGTGVQEKIEQTERYLRFLRMRFPLPVKSGKRNKK